MGKNKNRKGSRRGGGSDDASLSDDDGEMMSEADTSISSSATSSKILDFKNMDFAQRRELQRQQTQEKRRAKMKCYLCGNAGHVRRECPGIMDDGRGMSRFKSHFSDTKTAVAKHNQKRIGRKERSSSDSQGDQSYVQVDYPKGFLKLTDEDDQALQQSADRIDSFHYHDTNCDIDAMLAYLKSGRGKHRISQSEALQELQHYLECAMKQSCFGGMISISWLRKRRPWISPVPPGSFLEELQGKRLFFTVGLSPSDFLVDSSNDCDSGRQQQKQEAADGLAESLSSHPSLVAGFHATLDYSEDGLKGKGFSKECQLARLRWTCHAAGKCQVAVLVQIHPGITSIAPPNDDKGIAQNSGSGVAGTPYANVLLDLQQVLSECLVEFPSMKIHLSSWSGSASHMLAFQKAFPTLTVGLESSVTFQKAAHLHECAFELDLSNSSTPRLVLESNNSIPSTVANQMGRDAFSHPGWIPFIASAVAKHNRFRTVQVSLLDDIDSVNYAAVEVAKRTSVAAEALYPLLKEISG
jgi:Zinc knuckle